MVSKVTNVKTDVEIDNTMQNTSFSISVPSTFSI